MAQFCRVPGFTHVPRSPPLRAGSLGSGSAPPSFLLLPPPLSGLLHDLTDFQLSLGALLHRLWLMRQLGASKPGSIKLSDSRFSRSSHSQCVKNLSRENAPLGLIVMRQDCWLVIWTASSNTKFKGQKTSSMPTSCYCIKVTCSNHRQPKGIL